MQHTLFDIRTKTVEDISNPSTYKGIYSFHKYWGKKPTESIAYFIQNFTDESDIVLDPFLGSGLIGTECLSRNRNFIGVDLNPFSIEHATFVLDLPNPYIFNSAIKDIRAKVKDKINTSYQLENGKIASHYIWQGEKLTKVWMKPETGRSRVEFEPNQYDGEIYNSFSGYTPENIRKAIFFTNSRINSKPTMSISDLFTKRALRNIDIIIDEIKNYPPTIRRALMLTLTSSSGQMSSMVFAITGRGKTKNLVSDKIEVGSWVIGFWRPELHFEINVWNCFENGAHTLYNTLFETRIAAYPVFNSIEPIINGQTGASLINDNCLSVLRRLPDKSIKLICTDPPHSDRIPYLELSEMWNSILDKKVIFEQEIIVSNAKERNKKKDSYIGDMKAVINESSRILKDDGLLLIYYNARDKQSWKFMEIVTTTSPMVFVGAFPMEYSANSVVQDNRKGGLKTDYVLVMKHAGNKLLESHELDKIPGWTTSLPRTEG